jgi:MFS transporter, FSR family, fosmidomycin resistance protein
LFASLVEPFLGILGDTSKRRTLVVGGGILFALGLVLTALSGSFIALMLTFLLLNPASGAFVGLSQAALMDTDPSRHEHNMARWTFAGSIGMVVGPLALGAFATLGLGWRGLYIVLALFTVPLVVVAARHSFAVSNGESGEAEAGLIAGLKSAFQALRRREVLRWLALLQFSDLMLDVLHGYLALYFVDVVGVDPLEAGVAVAIWTGVGLLGDLLIIPLLERVRGLVYLRVSALLELILFPVFLLVPSLPLKLLIVGLMGFFNAGWYSILQAQLYGSMPGQSGTVLAINNVGGFVGALMPLAVGFVAGQFGLQAALWLLILGPIALLIGIPRRAVDAPLHTDDE